MKIIFKKSDLPFLSKFAQHDTSPRDHWRLATRMRDRDGFVDHLSSRELLLQRGAFAGDPWSMCELARHYYLNGESTALPLALSWWHKAARRRDKGALSDLNLRDLPARIRNYTGGKGSYADIEMRCALLAEWHLTRMGQDVWELLPYSQQLQRVEALVDAVVPVLQIPPTAVYVKDPLLTVSGHPADGVAHYDPPRRIGLNRGIFANYRRLLQVIFHELGHQVVFTMLYDGDTQQMARYGITEQRRTGWRRDAQGIEVPMTEEDPDSLSYGVYTTWLVLFGEDV